MALTVNDISANPYAGVYQAEGGDQKVQTTITPFSEILKKEKEQTARKTETSNGVAAKSGTTGMLSADGTLITTLDDIFSRASEKYGVSYEYLVAVAKAESDFNPNCVSSAGAKGIMQIMPEEAKGLGISDVFDPEQNIMGAAKLLAAHLEKFNGDTTLAAAAYNAGSGRVKQYGGVPPSGRTSRAATLRRARGRRECRPALRAKL